MTNQAQYSEIITIEQTKLVSFRDLEVVAGMKSHQVIRESITQWLEACEETNPQNKTRCRECGSLANYITKKTAFVSTKFGLIRYQRAYYVCPHCHAATCPLDERLNPLESLARLRQKIASGRSLPVAEMAKAWGLGSLEQNPNNPADLS